MHSRTVSSTAAMSRRASDMRRLRRRAGASHQRPYCGTNGCASFLEVDPSTGVASCPVCGYSRRLH